MLKSTRLGDIAYDSTRRIVHTLFDLISQVQVNISGKENLQERAILAANHQSFLDPAAIIYAVYNKPVYFLASNSFVHPSTNQIFKKAFGKVLSFYNQIIIQENNLSSYLSDIDERLSKGYLGIFPEGQINNLSRERINHGELLAFRKGIETIAKYTQAPVIPTTLKGTQNVWPPNNRLPKRSGFISISFSKPLSPNTPNLRELIKAQIKSTLESQ